MAIFEIIYDEKYMISGATFPDTIMHLTQRYVHKALRTIFVGFDIDCAVYTIRVVERASSALIQSDGMHLAAD